MNPIVFRRDFSTSKFLSVLLLTSPFLHICFINVLSLVFCCYFSTFPYSISLQEAPLLVSSGAFLFFNCPNSRRIQTQYQIPDWLGLCWIMQTILELWSGIPRHSAMHPAFWLPSRRAPSELVTKQWPDGIWEGRWEVESVISKVTFATELIIVKLLSSSWLCKAHLLWIHISEETIGHNQTHYRTDCQMYCCYNSLGWRTPQRKISPTTFVFWTSVCLCLWPLCCDVCELLSGIGKNEGICHLWPLLWSV